MIILIDNYDSFTYNLYQLLGELGQEVKVFRNDQITVQEIEAMKPSAIVLSPGPRSPKEAGICLEVVLKLAPKFPILGVCLGHQAIGEAFGGKVAISGEIVHGKPGTIFHNRSDLFRGVMLPFKAGRYHSLIVERASMPECLEILAENQNGLVMAVKHKTYPCYGVQFHPESIMTDEGKKIVKNFIERCAKC
jgi:anthranilate synthase/aminodeoxychorismate synthase-like glutamine amidotransferase